MSKYDKKIKKLREKKTLDEFPYTKKEQDYIAKLIKPFIIKYGTASFYITENHEVVVLDGDIFVSLGKIREE